jgi:hypothetical protein
MGNNNSNSPIMCTNGNLLRKDSTDEYEEKRSRDEQSNSSFERNRSLPDEGEQSMNIEDDNFKNSQGKISINNLEEKSIDVDDKIKLDNGNNPISLLEKNYEDDLSIAPLQKKKDLSFKEKNIQKIDGNDDSTTIFTQTIKKVNPDDKSCQRNSLFNKINDIKHGKKMKRQRNQRVRKYNADNNRRKIKRNLFNTHIRNSLNKKLAYLGISLSFRKLNEKFVTDVNSHRSIEMLNMTLKEIYENKDNYDKPEHYEKNKKIIDKIKDNIEFKDILNKKYGEIFEEFINSKEFNFDEIKKLKSKKEEDYIQNYIYVVRHFFNYRNL